MRRQTRNVGLIQSCGQPSINGGQCLHRGTPHAPGNTGEERGPIAWFGSLQFTKPHQVLIPGFFPKSHEAVWAELWHPHPTDEDPELRDEADLPFSGQATPSARVSQLSLSRMFLNLPPFRTQVLTSGSSS